MAHLIERDGKLYCVEPEGEWYYGEAPQPIVKTLDEIKADKKAELIQEYNNSFTTFQSSALGTVNTYPINQEARDNFERYERRMSSDPNLDIFSFYTLEAKNLVDHTRVQFIQLLRDAQAFEVQQHKHFNDKINQVDDPATDTKDKVLAITW